MQFVSNVSEALCTVPFVKGHSTIPNHKTRIKAPVELLGKAMKFYTLDATTGDQSNPISITLKFVFHSVSHEAICFARKKSLFYLHSECYP